MTMAAPPIVVRSPRMPGESWFVGLGLATLFPTVCDARGRVYGWCCRVIPAGTGSVEVGL